MICDFEKGEEGTEEVETTDLSEEIDLHLTRERESNVRGIGERESEEKRGEVSTQLKCEE